MYPHGEGNPRKLLRLEIKSHLKAEKTGVPLKKIINCLRVSYRLEIYGPQTLQS